MIVVWYPNRAIGIGHRSLKNAPKSRRSVSKGFDTVDLLVTPTAPTPPFKIDELLGNPNEIRTKEIVMLHNTRPFNVLGLPTISVPLPVADPSCSLP